MRVGPLFLLLLSSTALAANDEAASGVVEQGGLVKSLLFSGELQAVEERLVNTPNISRLWIYPVSYLTPEGEPVRPGDLLVDFDRTSMEYRKLETEKEREDARQSLARKETELESRKLDLLLQLAEAEKRLRNARLYADLDPQLIARADAERYQYEFSRAQIEVDKARQQIDSLAEAGRAELQVERLNLQKAELELRQIIGDLEKMSIHATAPGLPLYAWSNEGRKIQVGDNVFKGTPVLRIPSMENLQIIVSVYDAEFAGVRVGQPATVVLDAIPDRTFSARVLRIPEAATTPRAGFSRHQTRRFTVEVLLLEKDLSVMKPGMSARVEIPVTAGHGLIVPRSKVFLDDENRTFVLPRGAAAPVQVEVLDCNHDQALVKADLTTGMVLDEPEAANPRRGRAPQWHTVTAEDLLFTVSGSGTLEAARSTDITPPVVPNVWSFKIKRMVPEGKSVKGGEVVAELDAPEVHATLIEERASLEKIRQQLEKTRASLDLKLDALELQLEEASVASDKASNKLLHARQFESSLKILEAENEAQFARRKVEVLDAKLKSTRQGVELELELLRDREELHRRLAASAEEVLRRLQLRAPRDGIAIYAKNWANEKKQVGGDVMLAERVLYLPDLESLHVVGQVSELDAGKIRLGQKVQISIDALPDESFSGHIAKISQIFTQASWDRPVKVVEVEVELERADSARMRPGMVARLRVAVDRFEQVVTVPLTMVRTEGDDVFVWLQRDRRAVKTPIRLGRNNGVVGIVEAGLVEGDRILEHPPTRLRN